MATITYTDGSGTHTVTDVTASSGITVSDLDKNDEWDLTGIDNEPSTTVTAFIGGRPDDRK